MLLGLSLSVTTALAVIGFNTIVGIVGVVYYLLFIGYSLTNKLPDDTAHRLEKDIEAGIEVEEDEEDVPVYKGIGYLAVGGTLIFGFSKPFIVCVVDAASSLNVNPILLAFFLAPIASEMPEILESVSLARKGNSQNINIAMSNLIGGTMSKTTLLCGILCFFGVQHEFEWESPAYTTSLALLILCAGAAAAIGFLFKQQTQYHGIFLFVLFVVVGCVQYWTNASPDNLEIETTLT